MYSPSPLTPAVFHILLAIVDGERHGYGIMQEVSAKTGGKVVLGPGTLYGTINRMLEAGLIKESGERSDPEMNDERRRYYRITGKGRRAAVAEAERLQRLVRVARAKHLLQRSRLVFQRAL
jgi:DNA-binding PadR family transcriptional regulator